MLHYRMPLDPDCPVVKDVVGTPDNPRTSTPPGFVEKFEAKHQPKCDRCQTYGEKNKQVYTERGWQKVEG